MVNTIRTKNFTTTLSPQVISWLEIMSKKTGLSKREIIEHALERSKKEYTQHMLRKSYADAKKDKEWMSISNEGLKDWLQNG